MKSRRSIKISTKVVRATVHILHQFQGKKGKGQGHQAAVGGHSSHHLQEAGHIVAAALLVAQLVSNC